MTGVLGWILRRPLRACLGVVLGVIAIFTIYGVTREARHDRDWVEHLSRLPKVETLAAGQRHRISPVRNWSYSADGPAAKSWQDQGAEMDLTKLERIWFMVEPHPGLDVMAHTLVIFEFEGDQLLGLTIEARRETGEGYDPFWGNWGRFELLYVWASARDLLTRRAVMLDHEVYIYPLDLTAGQQQAFLSHVIDRTSSIEQKPRLYNTLFSNCTNELAKAARLGWSPAFILTGGAAQRLYSDRVIPRLDREGETVDFDVIRARSDFTRFLKDHNDTDPSEFNNALLAELRERFDGWTAR